MPRKNKAVPVKDLAARLLARYARLLRDAPEVCFDNLMKAVIQEVYETYDDGDPIGEAKRVINALALDLNVLIYELDGQYESKAKWSVALSREEIAAAAKVLETRYWNKPSEVSPEVEEGGLHA